MLSLMNRPMQANSLAIFIVFWGVISAAFSCYAWYYRATRGLQLFSIFMVSLTVYALGYGMELSSLNLSTMLFWSKIGYLGIFSFPTLFLMFVLKYTGRDRWLTGRNIFLLFLIPTLLLIAKWTDDTFHLVYSSVWVDTGGPIPLLGFTRGPVYPFALYAIIPVGLGIYLLWQKRQNTPLFYRKQVTLMVACTVLPLLFFLLYMSGYQPIPSLAYLDLNVFMYILWGIGLGWAIFRYQLFELAPIARDMLIERLGDGVVVLDDEDRLVDVNPEATKILGWVQAPIGQHALQAFSAWKELGDACLTTRGIDSARIEIQHSSGDKRVFFEVNITALFDDNGGRRMGRLVVIHDISDRKRAEENRENFQRYFNMGAIGMGIISPDWHWVEMNGRLCQILGYSSEELKQLTWLELTPSPDLETELVLFNDILSNQRDSYQLDKSFIRKDGTTAYTSTYVSCYRNSDGTTCYFLVSVLDISERKQAEAALLKLTTFNERQRLARDLHDSVNQSIQGLALFSETLVATLDKNNVNRAKQIAERIQESSRQALKETRLMLYEMQPEDGERDINFPRDLEARLLTVERHAGVEVQMIQEGSMDYWPHTWHENLFWITIEALNNALKHAQARNVQISIRCSSSGHPEETPQYLELEIVDDGRGFNPDKPRPGGLGLKNMRERAKLLGGELTIRSEPGKGTSVSFNAKTKGIKESSWIK